MTRLQSAENKHIQSLPESKGFLLSELRSEIFILFLLMLATGICAIAAMIFDSFDLSGDSAHYWEWSRRLDGCYYSKPPMVAYVIRLATVVLGNTEYAVSSAGALLFVVLLLPAAYLLGLGISQKRGAGLITLFAVYGTCFQAFSVLSVETNKLVSIFWLGAMFSFNQAVKGRRGAWFLTGLCLGLGLLSKQVMLFLMLSFLCYLLLVERPLLKTRGPYLAAAVAALTNIGVICWNLNHRFITYQHLSVLNKTGLHDHGLSQFESFLSGQFICINPLVFPLFIGVMLLMLLRFRRDKTAAYLFLCWAVPFFSFAALSLTRNVYPHWPMQAYYAAAAALGYVAVNSASLWLRRFIYGVTVLQAMLLLGVLCLTSFSPGSDQQGSHIGKALSPWAQELAQGESFLVANERCLASLAAFYTPGQPQAYCLPVHSREICQYDVWGGWDLEKGKDALVLLSVEAEQGQKMVDDLLRCGVFASAEQVGRTVVPEWFENSFQAVQIYKMCSFAGFDTWKDSGLFSDKQLIGYLSQ